MLGLTQSCMTLQWIILFFIKFSAWEKEEDPMGACLLFRQLLLESNSKCPQLLLSINMFDPEEEKDSSLIEFYKRNHVNWAAPFKCTLTGIAYSILFIY